MEQGITATKRISNMDTNTLLLLQKDIPRKDLLEYCVSHGIPDHGSKIVLINRIIHFKETGKVIDSPENLKAKNKFSLNSKIGRNVACSQELRSFFERHIHNFSFNVGFQRWLKNNPDKTCCEAINAYHKIKAERNMQKFKEIEPQFMYNRYIRDFFADETNKGRTLKDAARCWNMKKKLNSNIVYEQKDLNVLKKS